MAAHLEAQAALPVALVRLDLLLDRRLLAAPGDEVVELKLEGLGKKVELARKGPQWHLRAPEDRTLEAELGRTFLDDLLAIEADHLVPAPDLEALGLAHPRATLRMLSTAAASGSDGGVEERAEILEIGAEQGDFLMVRRAEDGAVAAVSKERAARLLPADTQLALLFREERAFLYPVLILPGGRDLQLLPWPAETPAGAAGADLRLPPEGWLRLPQAGAVRLIGAPAALTPAALRAIARVREPDTTKNDDRKR